MSKPVIVPLLGEAEAVIAGADGAETRLTLKLGNAEWVQVERVLGGSYLDIVSAMVTAEMMGRSVSLDTARTILWAATRRHHADLTLDDCGELVVQHGAEVMAPLGEAIRGAIKVRDPAPGEAEPAETPATPNGGIGTAS